MKKNDKVKSMIKNCDMVKSMQKWQIFDGFTTIQKYCDYAKERIENGIVDNGYICTIESELEAMKQYYNRYKTEEEKIQQLEALNK